MTRDDPGRPLAHRAPVDIGRSIMTASVPVGLGIFAAVALVLSEGATPATVLLGVAIVLGSGGVGYVRSDRVSDSDAWQAREAARRMRRKGGR